MLERVVVFAPASSSNLGPGFDILGVAVEGLGDRVQARWDREKEGIWIENIEGDAGRLPRQATENTAGIAALEVFKRIQTPCEGAGIALSLHKGLPLGSGLGSSGASAVAAAWAVNLLCGGPLQKREVLEACMAAEASVSGWHADNVGPSLLGGLVLVSSYEPLELVHLNYPENLVFVLVTPYHEVKTRDAREVIPRMLPLQDHIANSASLASMIYALERGNLPLFGRSVQDKIVEPARAALIPGFFHVKQAALEAGAYGCSISGAGPTIFAITDQLEKGQMIGRAMQEAFLKKASLESRFWVCRVDSEGARQVEESF